MLGRAVLAALVAAVVGLVLQFLLGPLLVMIATPPTQLLGGFLETFAWLIAIVCGIWYFFAKGGLTV